MNALMKKGYHLGLGTKQTSPKRQGELLNSELRI